MEHLSIALYFGRLEARITRANKENGECLPDTESDSVIPGRPGEVGDFSGLYDNFKVVDVLEFICSKSANEQLAFLNTVACFGTVVEFGATSWLLPIHEPRLEELYVRAIQVLYTFARVREFKGREDCGYVGKDFIGSAEKAAWTLKCMHALMDKSNEYQKEEIPNNEQQLFNGIKTTLLLYSILLLAEHAENTLWSSEESLKESKGLLSSLLHITNSSCVGALLSNKSSISKEAAANSMFTSVINEIQPKLTISTWKLNPGKKYVFKWCLVHLAFPHVGVHLDSVLPVALRFTDDFQLENKVLGIQCLNHIINNVTKVELQRNSKAEIIYDALQHQMYNHEDSVIDILLPCLVQVLVLLEKGDQVQEQFSKKETRWDSILQRILTDMEGESKLILRRVYAKHLPLFIRKMGIVILRHFKRLQTVVQNYLEQYDGPVEAARFHTLETLQVILQICWPRMEAHCHWVMKLLFQLVCEISMDETLTPQKVKDELVHKATECLVLLKHICPHIVTVSLQELESADLNAVCKNCISNVLTHS